MSNKYKVAPISAETLAAIKRKSAFSLPDKPSERGMKPDEIKHTLFGPITDSENSAIAELSRVIGELNQVLAQIEEATGGIVMLTQIEGGKRLTVKTDEGETSVDIIESYSKAQINEKLGKILPTITEADEGKILMVVGGVYSLEEMPATEGVDAAAIAEIDTLVGEGV